jgi:hypothetical protein
MLSPLYFNRYGNLHLSSLIWMPTCALDIEWLLSSTPFDTATCCGCDYGRFCCVFVIFGCTRNCEFVDLLRSVAIVFGRLNVARFVSFDLMRHCLLILTSDMMKLEHFQWSKVMTAMLAFEAINSLMFGSLLPMR